MTDAAKLDQENPLGVDGFEFVEFTGPEPEAMIARLELMGFTPTHVNPTTDAVRLKQGGGHGGHNGLRDIIARLGGEVTRLRIGIGHPGHRDQVVSYVLHPPGREERRQIDEALTCAAAVFPDMLSGRMAWAMQTLNTARASLPHP